MTDDQTTPEAISDASSLAGGGPHRSQRSALVTFAQTILGLEALAMLFVVINVGGLQRAGELDAPAWFGGVGIAVAVAMALATGLQRRPWGVGFGWALQVPMIAAILVEVTIGIIGIIFLVLWGAAVRIGRRIDRERAVRADEARSPEQ